MIVGAAGIKSVIVSGRRSLQRGIDSDSVDDVLRGHDGASVRRLDQRRIGRRAGVGYEGRGAQRMLLLLLHKLRRRWRERLSIRDGVERGKESGGGESVGQVSSAERVESLLGFLLRQSRADQLVLERFRLLCSFFQLFHAFRRDNLCFQRLGGSSAKSR